VFKTKRKFLIGALSGVAALAGCSSDDGPCDPEAPGTICTIVGSGENGGGRDYQEDALTTNISVPMDMAISPDGDLWVIDFNNYQIRALGADGVLTNVIGTGLVGDSPQPVDGTEPCNLASFNHTPDMYFHSDGFLYLAAWHNSRVKRVNLAAMEVENYAGLGKRTLYTGDDGPAMAAAVDLPSSITADLDGNIVFMDQANQVIRMVDQDGNIHRIGGQCVVDEVYACADGQVPEACPDSNKTVCGSPETECAKPCTPGFGGDGGLAIDARLALPFGQKADPAGRLAYDADGNLYFADSENDRIRKIDTDGIISTVAGTGVGDYGGDDGPAVDAMIDNPVDIEVAANGEVYFADVNNGCIRKIGLDGIISRVAGVCSNDPDDHRNKFAGDGGDPLDAILDRPYGIELTPTKLYIADSFNHRIRVVNF
jgi:hypothetical protein